VADFLGNPHHFQKTWPKRIISRHNENNRVRTLRDHMNPTITSAPSSIVFSPHVSHFNFKPVIIQLLPFSHGLDLENPY